MGQLRGCSPRMQDLSCRQRPPKPRLRIHLARPSREAQHRPHPHHPCRQPDPAAGTASHFFARSRSGSRSTRRPSTTASTQSVKDIVRQQAEAGIDVVSDGEFGKTDQLVAICAGAADRIRATPDQSRRQSVRARRRPRPVSPNSTPSSMPATRRQPSRESGLRRPDHLYRAGGAAARHRQFQGGAGQGQGRRRRSCRWRRLRASSPTARTNITRTKTIACSPIAEAMRTEYRMIVDAGLLVQLDDARTAVTYDRMVPPASFADYRNWVAHVGRGDQSRARRHPGGSRALSRLLGQLARPHTTDVPLRTSSTSS